MAKRFATPILLEGPAVNTSGLIFSRMTAASPAVAGATVGVDVAGNLVVIGAPTYRTVLLQNVANAANSSADVAALSATIPANSLTVGSLIQLQLVGNVVGGNSTYNFWIKVGTTKILTASFQLGIATTVNGQWGARAYLTVRNIGTAAVLSTYLQVLNDASNVIQSSTGTQTIDSTVAQTVTAGFNWTNAGTNNIITATQGIIAPM